MSWLIILKRELKVGLISGRHEIPVEEYVFEGPIEGEFSERPEYLYGKAWEWLNDNKDRFNTLHLYLTGLTMANNAFINAFRKFDNGKLVQTKKLILYYHDSQTNDYVADRWN